MKSKYTIIILALLISLIPVNKSIGVHEASIGQMINPHALAEPISQLKTKPIELAEQKGTTPKPKPVKTAQNKPVAKSMGAMSNCGDNADASFIYGMESGGRVPGRCNPGAVNEIGCRGIGQSCPGSKLPCGADYACQNKWFTNYAMERYGSWSNARAFWERNNWW